MLICLCIDELEQMANEFVNKLGIAPVDIENVDIMFFWCFLQIFQNMPKSLWLYKKTL